MPQARRLCADDEISVDGIQSQSPIGAAVFNHLLEFFRADDDDIGAASVRGIGFNPSVAEADVCGLRDDVVAPVACWILKEARAPIAVSQVPPVLLAR